MSSRPMISVAGIRGVVGESLLPEEFIRYVLAFATLSDGGPIVVGGDSRLSRSMMRHLAFAALESAGCAVHDLGLVPTPTVGMMIRELKARGGIAITASHNPAQWNAYKFFGPHGSFLNQAENEQLLDIAASGAFRRVGYKELGKVTTRQDAIQRHVARVLATVNVNAIRARKFRVAVDCVNGVGAFIARPLLAALNCEVTWHNIDVDAEFPRNPEPLPENLKQFGEQVRQQQAAVGFAIDPDADRLALVDETGRPIGEERTLVLCAESVLARECQANHTCGPIVANLSTSRALDDVASHFGVPLIRTPIGEAHVVSKIRDSGALIGGEGNGGVIFPAVHTGRDSATGIALILDALARQPETATLSALNATVPDYAMVKIKFPAEGIARELIIQRMKSAFADAADLNTLDGLKASYADRWVHARPSGTEPVVRVFAEAPTEADARAIAEKAKAAIISA